MVALQSGRPSQIIESSPRWGVRSAQLKFRRPGSDQTVTLFPMVHIGEAAFYDLVYRAACDHEVMLVEGVKSPVVNRLTSSYRWIGQRLDLIVQPRHPLGNACRAEVINADLSGAEFEQVWRELPIWQRWMLAFAAPLWGLRMRWFGTREMIAGRLGMDDAMSRDELLRWCPESALLDRVLLDRRDARLIEILSEQIATSRSIAWCSGRVICERL